LFQPADWSDGGLPLVHAAAGVGHVTVSGIFQQRKPLAW